MKKYAIEDIRREKGLPYGVIQSTLGEIDNALASNYIHKILVRTQVKAFKEKKEYPILKELMFIDEQMDRMEKTIIMLSRENIKLKKEIELWKKNS